jgi:glycosyltransferase involved in cell wall biosynthesis
MNASLIVCAHNPRIDILERVLTACNQQESQHPFEVILVDSGSADPLEALSKRFKCRVLRENEPGLATARARGIAEAQADTLIFVDDDTILDTDYLRSSLSILEAYPFLGAIGGQLIPEFEVPLPLPVCYYRERLAIREFAGQHWSNRWDDFATTPIGGGMVVRRLLAMKWVETLRSNNWASTLGRRRGDLGGGEDYHLTYTICSTGYGKGIFDQLRLTHFIPAHRLTIDFLERISEANAKTAILLKAMILGKTAPPATLRHKFRMLLELANCRNNWDRRLLLAEFRGAYRGWKAVQAINA